MQIRKARELAEIKAQERRQIPFRAGALDVLTNGGAMRDHCTLVSGDPKTGKNTILYLLLRSFQEIDDRNAIIQNQEGKYDPVWGAALGVDESRVFLGDPSFQESVLNFILDIAKNDYSIGFIGVDSWRTMVIEKRFTKVEANKGVDAVKQISPEAVNLNKFYDMLQVYQFKRMVRGVGPLMLVALNHESTEPPAFPGGAPKRQIPSGKNQRYMSSLRLHTLNPKYSERVNWLGMAFPTVVEFGYEIEGQEGPTCPRYVDNVESSGSFKVGQIGTRKGIVLDQEYWWKVAWETRYVGKKDGNITLGDKSTDMKTKEDVLLFWTENLKEYHQAQDEMLPLAIQYQDALVYEKKKRKKEDADGE